MMTEKNKRDIHLYADKEILNPNCSETVFRLVGDFKKIKKEVNNIIDWVEMEYDGRVGGGAKRKIEEEMASKLKQIRTYVQDAKNLQEIENLVIDFTCNYETFFKEEDGELLVATCNNYNYDNVDKYPYLGDQGYYSLIGKTCYDIIDKYDESWILKLTYDDEDHNKYPVFIVTDKNVDLFATRAEKIKKGSTIDLIIRENGIFQFGNNQLHELPLMKDKEKLNKIKIVFSIQES